MKSCLFVVPLFCSLSLAIPALGEEKPAEAAEPAKAMEETTSPGLAGGPVLVIPVGRLSEVRPSLQLRLETWEVPAIEMAHKQDAGQSPVEVAKWREDWFAGKDAAQLIFSPQISLNAATRMTAESVYEVIYPTEYEPPQLPGSFAADPAPPNPTEAKTLGEKIQAAMSKTTPTAFTTRNSGQTLQAIARPVTAVKGQWDVSSALEDVSQTGAESWGAPELNIQMPTFNSFRTGGVVRLKEAEWHVLSILPPPHDSHGPRPKTRWITLIRIDPE